MVKDYQFQIESDPVPAARPNVTSRGITYYPKRHAAYSELLKSHFNEISPFKFKGPVEVRFLFAMPAYKTSDHPVHRSDVDNLAKLPMDSMTKSKTETGDPRFWEDDCFVVNLTALKRFVREGEKPHTKVKVVPITDSVEDYVDRIFDS